MAIDHKKAYAEAIIDMREREKKVHRRYLLTMTAIYAGAAVACGALSFIPNIGTVFQGITIGAASFFGLATAHFHGRYRESFWRP